MTLSLIDVPLSTNTRLQVDEDEKSKSIPTQFDRFNKKSDSRTEQSPTADDDETRDEETVFSAVAFDGESESEEIARDISKEVPGIKPIAPTNTRNIGTLITVQLIKEAVGGLGFSITARDNQSAVDSPIYIKNVLPNGAAFRSGRLRPGDRLIQVDEVVMNGISLSEATALFRTTKVGSSIKIVVSRQISKEEDEDVSLVKVNSASEQDMADKSSVDICLTKRTNIADHSSECHSESIMQTLTLRLISDGPNADQLGVRVKRSRKLNLWGLYVRSIVPGSIADKDGQLLINDCLTDVNGISVIDLEKTAIIDMFRSVVKESLKNNNVISITVIRQKLLEKPSSLPPLLHPTIVNFSELPNTYLQIANILKGNEISEHLSSAKGKVSLCENQDSNKGNFAFPNGNCVISFEKHSSDFLGCEDSLQPPVLNLENGIGHHHENSLLSTDSEAQLSSRAARGALDGKSEDQLFLELSCAVDGNFPHDEDTILDSGEIVFRRDGFGRRSISEKRSYQDFLSRSEIYRNIKENRKRKEFILHAVEEKPCFIGNAATDDCLAAGKDATELTFSTEKATLREKNRDSTLSNSDQTNQTLLPLTSVCSSTEACSNAISAPASELTDSSVDLLSTTGCGKPSKKFDTSTIRGFFKKGFSEWFRTEKKSDSLQCSPVNRTTTNERLSGQRSNDNYHLTRGSSLPRLASCHNARDSSALVRFPSHAPYGQYHTGTLPSASSSMYFARLHRMPSTRSTFPLRHFHLNSDLVASGLLEQNRPPVPSSRPVNMALNGAFFYPSEQFVIQPQLVQHKNPVLRMFHVIPCRPSWTRPWSRQKEEHFARLPCPDSKSTERYHENAEN